MTIIDLVRVLRRNWLLLLVGAVLGGAIAAAYVFTRPIYYVASATGIVVAGDSTNVGSVVAGNAVAEERAGAYLTLLNTGAVADRVTQELEKSGHPEARGGGYSGSLSANTPLITINATGNTPENAQHLANAALSALSIEALRMETYAQTQGREVSVEQMRSLTSIYILGYEPAALPQAPVRTDLARNLALGLAAGLGLGAAIAVVRRMFDVRIRTQSDVETATSHAVLGVIPDTRDLRKQRDAGPVLDMGHAGEALRQLRTNLRFAKVDDPPRSVVITSAKPGEGKSTIASNLASLIAKSGQDVILVDGDLRKPVQATIFQVDSQVGLTQVLAGDVKVADALIETPTPRLMLLPAGRIPPNPSELAGSRRMEELVAELSKQAFVIVDAPPLLAVTDGGLLAAACDGTILVSVVGKTHKIEVAQSAKQLDQIGAALLGNVLNKAPRSSLGEVLYGYGYGASYYESYYTSEDGTRKKRSRSRNPMREASVEVGEARRGARRMSPPTPDEPETDQ